MGVALDGRRGASTVSRKSNGKAAGGASAVSKRVSGKASARSSKRLPPPVPDVEDLLGGSEGISRVRNELLEWYDASHRVLPWRWNPRSRRSAAALAREASEGRLPPPPGLSADDRVYRVWVCEVMSQQTQLSRVVEKFKDWIERWPDVRALARASEDEVQACWAGLGYYRRARALLAGAKKVVELAEKSGTGGEEHEASRSRDGETATGEQGEAGQRRDGNQADAAAAGGPTSLRSHSSSSPLSSPRLFPSSAAELQRLIPGIGPYTASAIASNALSEPIAAVDGNVQRVLARLGAVEADPASTAGAALFAALADRLLDRDRPGCWNQALMELGAVVCLPNGRERCGECPLRDRCRAHAALEAYDEGGASARGAPPPPIASYPRKAAKAARRETTVAALVVRANVVRGESDGGRGGEAGKRPGSTGSGNDRAAAVLLARRPEDGLLGGLWEFPGVEEAQGSDAGKADGKAPTGKASTKRTTRPNVVRVGGRRANKTSARAASSDEEILFDSSAGEDEEEEEEEAEFVSDSSSADENSDASADSDAAPWENEKLKARRSASSVARTVPLTIGRAKRVTRSQTSSGSSASGTLLGFFAPTKSAAESARGNGKEANEAGENGDGDKPSNTSSQADSSDENASRNEEAGSLGGREKRAVARAKRGLRSHDEAALSKRAKGEEAGKTIETAKENGRRTSTFAAFKATQAADEVEEEKGGAKEKTRIDETVEAKKEDGVDQKVEAKEEVMVAKEARALDAEMIKAPKAKIDIKTEALPASGSRETTVKTSERGSVTKKKSAGDSAGACAPISPASAASAGPTGHSLSSDDAYARVLRVAADAAASAIAAASSDASTNHTVSAACDASSVPTSGKASIAALADEWLAALQAAKPTPLGSFVHVFSHIRMTVDVHLVDLTGQAAVRVPANALSKGAPTASQTARWLWDADVAEAGLTSSVLKTWKLVQTNDSKAKAKAKNGLGRFFTKA